MTIDVKLTLRLQPHYVELKPKGFKHSVYTDARGRIVNIYTGRSKA